MPSKTYNNETLAAQERSRRLGISPESDKSAALAGLRAQRNQPPATGNRYEDMTTDELLADAHRYMATPGFRGANKQTARSEDFTDPTRTAFQEMGRVGGRVGGLALGASIVPGPQQPVLGAVGTAGLGLQGLQQAWSPFEGGSRVTGEWVPDEESETELDALKTAALIAAPSMMRQTWRGGKAAVNAVRGKVPYVPRSPGVASGPFSSTTRSATTVPDPSLSNFPQSASATSRVRPSAPPVNAAATMANVGGSTTSPLPIFNPRTNPQDLLSVLGSKYRSAQGMHKDFGGEAGPARIAGATLSRVGKIVNPEQLSELDALSRLSRQRR